MKEITCKCGCGRKKLVREADIKRGWGKFYSKSCKAKEQERRTGQYAELLHSSKKEDGRSWLLRNIDNKLRGIVIDNGDDPDWLHYDDMDGHFSNETSNQF